MNTSFYIAKRYLFSKKSVNAIHIISGISMLGILVGSAALIIILSVFNGFEQMILSMYNDLSPEIRIESQRGKSFDPQGAPFNQIQKDKRVLSYTEVLQEKALIRYGKSQYIAQIKGVSADFTKGRLLDSTLYEGNFSLQYEGDPRAIIGSSVQAYLSVNIQDEFQPLEIYSPRKGKVNSINPADEFVVKTVFAAGVFKTQADFDNLVLVPLSFARELLDEPHAVSAIEINLNEGVNAEGFKKELEQKLGKAFVVKDRVQQNQLLYKILNSEKWAIFLILTFVLIIAIFNIIGSLTMLVLDKRKDMAILSSMGAGKRMISRIFFAEGMMIAGLGCVIGILLGLAFCLFQQQTGYIKMDEGNAVIMAYPIALKASDFVLVTFTVFFISGIASAISSRLSVKNLDNLKEDL
ncbi:MAG: ABC transporter permease [Sphingobacteriaceae bacterium]